MSKTKRPLYTPPVHCTAEELAAAARADLLSDAEHAERQAVDGPYYPERGITRKSLLAYAAECRSKASVE
jgi:hypothetical protein